MKLKLKGVVILFSLGFILAACGGEEPRTSGEILDNVQTFTADQIFAFDHVDTVYFSHLGYQSEVLENGNIVIPDREIPSLVVIDELGKLKKRIGEGRGPGEVLDAYRFTKDINGHIYTYDQDNEKLIIYDENLDLIREIIPPNYEATTILKAYPTGDENQLLFELTSFEYLRGETKDRENILIQYDIESEAYGEEMTLEAQPYARLYIDGRPAGATLVPYSYGNITAYNPEDQTLFVFDTATDLIAEISASFDTVRTIPVNFPTEEISAAERDSMEAEYNDARWDVLKDVLPEIKAPVQEMIYQNGEFWMESNIEGDTEMWLVLNMEGQITKVVHLPKESLLMHVSDEHLGVRLDDVTFALFENPTPESSEDEEVTF
ncbi:MAG: hypothetical protein HUJ22_06375 [Gracilimonas sp.]|uniref:6-bladed beta-propeller n=1 Tax=Gracilimonas sp. TaxID=1974203 RepID=UPI0019B112FE|nr:6-bladed beta-propeller [Gracilimonas sp.]MBD3616184.1 hypothetical protein [Gracilimonas sp.]